jgi:hypothetical protein
MKTNTKKSVLKTMISLVAIMYIPLSSAGLLDPNCTAEKAAKSVTAKATVGVGGRCSPAEAAKDSVKKVVPDKAKDSAKKVK